MISSHDLYLVAVTGLFSAPHCMVMCGGTVSAFTLNSRGSGMAALLSYNLGRILTYTFVGGFMGFVGSFVNGAAKIVGFQGAASMLGGIFILLWVFRKQALPLGKISPLRLTKIRILLENIRSRHEWWSIAASGMLLGFIPCGLTYAMQMNAAASGSLLSGSTLMLVFGLATLPALAAVAIFAAVMKKSLKNKILKIGNMLAIVIGLLSIMRGLSANGWILPLHPWLW